MGAQKVVSGLPGWSFFPSFVVSGKNSDPVRSGDFWPARS